MRRMVVGVDGSSVARDALVWSATMAAKLGAEVLAVNCFQRPYSEMNPETHDRLLTERKALLTDGWTGSAAEVGADVRALVGEGDPRNVLLPMAETEGADLLVLGRSGAGGGPGVLHLGSVVEQAAHHSSIPLAVVPAGWSDPV